MIRAARFGAAHSDPFDRMISAHAIQYNPPLLTTDAKLEAFGVRLLNIEGFRLSVAVVDNRYDIRAEIRYGCGPRWCLRWRLP